MEQDGFQFVRSEAGIRYLIVGQMNVSFWSRSVGGRTLGAWPTPRRRYRARGAARISVRPPRPRRSQVLGAGKFLQQPAVRDGLHAYRHLPIEADRAVRGNSVALAPACQGRAPTRLREKQPFALRRHPRRVLPRYGLGPVRPARSARRRPGGARPRESAPFPFRALRT